MNIRFWLLLFPIALSAMSFNGKNDFQFWLQDSVQAQLIGRFYMRGEQEFRFTEHSSKLYYTHNQISIKYIASKHFELEPIYRQTFVRKKNAPNSWQPHYDPMLDVTLKTVTKSKWAVSDRNRVEYVMKSGPDKSLWTYRNMIKIVAPFSVYVPGLNPVIFDEVFWKEQNGIAQNRLAGGAQIKLIGTAMGSCVYMFRSLKKSTGWVNQNVVFCQLKINF